MPDLLGATNPVPGYDSNSANRRAPIPPTDLQIQNIPDPSRVGRPDARTDQQDTGAQNQQDLPRYDSNFNTFLQRLRQAPDLTQTLTQLLLGRTGVSVTSGLGQGSAAQLGEFLAMLRMDQGQLLHFLSSQFASATRFGGPLFSILRQALQSSGSSGMKTDILQFLKRYSNFSSTGHIQGNLMRNLNLISRSIPASWAGRLLELTGQLQNGIQAGDRSGNLRLLQGEILPYLSDYVERTHDMGRARGLLSMLVLDISRYESGSQESLLQAFHLLQNYQPLSDRLGGLDDATLLQLLRSSEFAKSAEQNTYADSLAKAANQALRGSNGVEAQAAFRELVSAFLVNESVYMPLQHFLLPLEWNGKMMFSEFWVDPDAGEEGRPAGGEENRVLRFLFKLDIQSLGFFDMVLTCQASCVDLQIQCPEAVAPFGAGIERSLTSILTKNGLKASSVQIKPMSRPVTISEIFPKIFDGRDSVNVKV